MKSFTNKGVTQKIIIALVIVILTTFSVPAPVQADWGGKLMSPIITFLTAILDGAQHMLEWAMLGETSNFMKDYREKDTYNTTDLTGTEITVKQKLDGSFYGLDAVNVPVIQYTPEEIFTNRVPALDINFISPSVKTGNDDIDKERNVAIALQPTIASWYVALRTIAVVGLLSVLVYLGIRMLLTSIAADRAKYKQMLMDWVVAICLVFVLHYIMSFALTMVETVTSMISPNLNGTVTVVATQNTDIPKFGTNLMGYVRFMVQCADLNDKLAFFFLYLMLVIYSVRFTWVYLKRVVNMAFLTLMAPMVALTYPIDKVSDGKAQAFNMWIKEFTYNALIQPLHLLLYIVLLGSAVELAVSNPLYAIVALGFIIAAEKLVKKMFGFDKASGGTVGSLAGAAGVTAMAGKALNSIGQKGSGAGGKGKVRTKDIPERQGKDAGVNSPFDAFKGRTTDNVLGGGTGENDERSKVLSPEEQEKWDNYAQQNNQQSNKETLDDLEQQRAELYNQGYTDNSDEVKEINDKINSGDWSEETPVTAPTLEDTADLKDAFKPSGTREPNLWDVMKQDTANFSDRIGSRAQGLKDGVSELRTREGKRKLLNKVGSDINKRAIGAWKALPTVGYKAARGTLKTASRLALAGAMGTMGAVIGATTGDADKAMSMALGAAGVGFSTGDNLFEATAGKVMKDRSIRDAYGAGKYGNKIDARNARADKEYFRSEKFDDFYEKYYKGKSNKVDGKAYTKKQIQDITQSYRQAGITSEKDIRRAIKLEEQYRVANKNLSEDDARKQVQNIVQSYGDIDLEKKAFTDEKVKQKEIERIAGMLDGGATPNNRKVAEQIFKGYEDWRNT